MRRGPWQHGLRYQPNYAQYRMLVARNLRLRPGSQDFFHTLIDAAGPAYLTGVLRSQNMNVPVTPDGVRGFLADRFAADYAADPARFDQYLISDDGTPISRDDAIVEMRDPAVFDTMMAAVTPRLAADYLALNITILNQSGAFEELSPAEYGDHQVLLMTTGDPGDPLAELVPGDPAPPDYAEQTTLRPVVPDELSAGPQLTPGLAALTRAATTLAAARAQVAVVADVRLEAGQARDAAYRRLLRPETGRSGDEQGVRRRRPARGAGDRRCDAGRGASRGSSGRIGGRAGPRCGRRAASGAVRPGGGRAGA